MNLKAFLKNIPRRIFEDRRDEGGGVIFATSPLYLSALTDTSPAEQKQKKAATETLKTSQMINIRNKQTSRHLKRLTKTHPFIIHRKEKRNMKGGSP